MHRNKAFSTLFSLFFLSFLPIISSQRRNLNKFPIILVPGDGGSQLQAKLNKTCVVHYVCEKKTKDYFDLWLNLELMVPLILDCFVDNMKLVYNTTSRMSEDSPGVTVRVAGFGNTSTVEWLDASQNRVGQYFAAIVQNAVKWGYTRGKDIRGAPFDFRKSPNEAAEYFVNLKKLIEETYYANGNQKVVTIGHSMGNPYMLYFFNRQKQIWKDKFIQSHVSISAPWGGSMKILKMLATGYNLDHWRLLLSPITLRTEQRSMTSTTFLVPTDKFWAANETLVETPKRNYTVNDYEQFFKDIGFYDPGWLMYKVTGKLIYDLTPPGVEIHCLYGTGIPTPDKLVYSSNFPTDSQPREERGDGDGTVNVRSLMGCAGWKGAQKEGVFVKGFPGQDHLDILKNPSLISYIRQLLNPTHDTFIPRDPSQWI